jgi:Domain of unknown function (DUF1993)
MATSLYDLSVPTFLQTVKAVGGFLDRAARHCAETRADPNDFVHARLFDDMAPFHFQIEAAWHHSVWGLEAVKTGAFAPPALVGPVPFADLQAIGARGVHPRRGQQLGGQGPGPSNRPAEASLHVGDPHPFVFAAQLLFPRRHRIRHPAHAGCAARKARLRGPAAHSDCLEKYPTGRFRRIDSSWQRADRPGRRSRSRST